MITTKILVGAALLAGANAALAQAPAASSPAIDPVAMAALDRMGVYLRTLQAFQVTAETSREDVLDDGQKIVVGGTYDLLLSRPNGLWAEVTNDRQQREFFYDGKAFTLSAPRANLYATVPAPSTLGELIDRLFDEYDIEIPLADLFFWGTPRGGTHDIHSALDIGPAEVGGTSCEQYAFRQDALDWQVWIQLGAFPLPRKLVLTTLTDEARPQFRSVLTWNLAPAFNDGAFTFTPPADAKKIPIRETAPRSGASK